MFYSCICLQGSSLMNIFLYNLNEQRLAGVEPTMYRRRVHDHQSCLDEIDIQLRIKCKFRSCICFVFLLIFFSIGIIRALI